MQHKDMKGYCKDFLFVEISQNLLSFVHFVQNRSIIHLATHDISSLAKIGSNIPDLDPDIFSHRHLCLMGNLTESLGYYLDLMFTI